MLSTLAGNGQTAGTLQAALAAGSLPHAVLLCAPDGCGRNYAARCLMADYLFPQKPDEDPGKTAVMRGESPEVLLVAGEGKSGQIPVDRIRAVRSDVFHSALSAAGRAVHIRDAHRMAAPAANALLKVLEEPPADVLFVLTAQSPAALPATIVSRCAVYTLAPAGEQDCRALLEKQARQLAAAAEAPPKAAGGPSSGAATATPAAPPPSNPAISDLPGLLCALYSGRAGLALRAAKDADRLAVVVDALAAVKAAAARDPYGLLCLFSRYEGRADGDREKRDALLSDMTDALDASLRDEAKNGLPAVPPAVAAMFLPHVGAARAALKGNAAPKIVFTGLVAKLSREGRAG